MGEDPIKLKVFNTLEGACRVYKDLVVGGRRSARLLAAVGVSEVLNAMQTRLKKIYSDTYRGI